MPLGLPGKLNKDLLHDLLCIPAPSGAEEKIQEKVYSYLQPFAHDISADLHGNLVASLNQDAPLRVLLAAHCDQIGFMVRYIDPDGFLFMDPVGGPDEGTITGMNVVVLGKDGPIQGVIGKRAVHLETKKQKDTVPTFDDIWVDIGATSREEAEKWVNVGDYVTFEPSVRWLQNDLVAAPSLDNRAGLFVALEAFRLCAERQNCKVGFYVASTVQEELGMRGAQTVSYRVKPDVAIALDVTNASDDPGKKPKSAICKLGKGPGISKGPNTNCVLYDWLTSTASANELAFQVLPSADLEGNDSKVLQVSAGPSATITIGIPNRNMHSPAEVCHWRDLETAVQLLVEFTSSLDPKVDFRPLRNFVRKGGENNGKK